MTIWEASVVLSMAENDMNAVKAARMLNCAPCTIGYYLNKTAKETGCNARNFFDLCRLVPMAQEILGQEPMEPVMLAEIPHCKNCRYWLEEFGEVCAREEDWFYTAPEDFCSRGRQKLPELVVLPS